MIAFIVSVDKGGFLSWQVRAAFPGGLGFDYRHTLTKGRARQPARTVERQAPSLAHFQASPHWVVA